MSEPTRADLDRLPGALLLEFGASWCPICQATRPLIDAALARHPSIRHLWIEDARGRPLGRSFHIKLWPTLVFLRDGRELARLVRPRDPAALDAALSLLATPPTAARP